MSLLFPSLFEKSRICKSFFIVLFDLQFIVGFFFIKIQKDIRLMNKESFRFEEIKEDIIRNDK